MCFLTFQVHAQIPLSNKADSLEFLKIIQNRVATIDIFIDKFNGVFEPNSPKTDSFRQKCLMAVSHSNLILKDTAIFRKFMLEVVKDSLQLQKGDSAWYAETVVELVFNQKKEKASLILQYVCQQKNSDCEWVIKGIKADFIEKSFAQKKEDKYILPNKDATDFLILHDILEKDKKNAYQYMSAEKPNVRDIFLFGIQTGSIKFTKVEKVVYHFLNLKNWIFTVEPHGVDAKIKNSGYLITTLQATDPTKKNAYLNSLQLW